MKKQKMIFTVSCAVLLIILGFSLYKSYFQNPVSKDPELTSDTPLASQSLNFSQINPNLMTEFTETFIEETMIETTYAPIPTEAVDNDFSCFDNSVFIGNSRFVSFKNYGLCKNVYAVVGLTVDTIFTKSATGNGTTVIDSLYGKDYDNVILMLGDNECGWPNLDIFIERYEKVIDAVKQRLPNAEIYIHAVLPISAEASAKNQYGCNNNAINTLNSKIKQLCAEKGIKYIPQPSSVKGADGALLPDAASDGIHLKKSYSEIWLNELKTVIK